MSLDLIKYNLYSPYVLKLVISDPLNNPALPRIRHPYVQEMAGLARV